MLHAGGTWDRSFEAIVGQVPACDGNLSLKPNNAPLYFVSDGKIM